MKRLHLHRDVGSTEAPADFDGATVSSRVPTRPQVALLACSDRSLHQDKVPVRADTSKEPPLVHLGKDSL